MSYSAALRGGFPCARVPDMAKKAAVKEASAEEREIISRVYEAGYHIVSSVAENDLDGIIGTLRALIEKAGGALIAEGAPALTKLAYPMYAPEGGKNVEHDRAYFGWLKFEAPAEVAGELVEHLSHTPVFLRSMVFRTVREDTRAKIKIAPMREVKGGHTLKAAPRRTEEAAAPVSEADLEKALGEITE